jgi:hypothetical protein
MQTNFRIEERFRWSVFAPGAGRDAPDPGLSAREKLSFKVSKVVADHCETFASGVDKVKPPVV